MTGRRAGFTLIELLVVVLLLNLAMVGLVGVLRTYTHVEMRQDADAAQHHDLRFAMNLVSDTLRNAGYGVPAANLGSWVTWVPGFATNPTIRNGTAGSHIVSIARTTPLPVAALAAHVNVGATDLPLTTTSGVSAGSKRLLVVGDSENALVIRVSGGNVVVDTNPLAAGQQGLTRAYPEGTPVYRVDVITFSVSEEAGKSQLVRDENQGAGPRPAAGSITGLQLAQLAGARQYRVTLDARSVKADPVSGKYRQSSLRSGVVIAN